jgi:RNA polymerase sigma factor (sigma-70 family)
LGNGRIIISSNRNAGDLLAEFKLTGRQEAFEEIVRRYAAMVFGVCLKTTRNAHDAEDATQAVFLTLAVQCKTDKGGITYVGPWLQKVARRISLDLRRSKKRREVRETNHAVSNGNGNGNGHSNGHSNGNGSSGIDVEEVKVVLNEELNQLPAKYRLPMILHYYGGLTREQIAAELGCKPSTLGVRIHRGRQMLAKRLTQRGASPVEMGMSLSIGLTLAVKSAVSDGMVAATSHAAAKLMAGEQLGTMISSHVLAVAHGAAGAALIAKMKLVAAVIVVAAVLGAGAGATAKVLPLDQLKLQLPFSFDGLFKLPTLRSPFRAPQANAGAGGTSSNGWHPLESAAAAGPVRTVMLLAQDDLVGRSRPAPAGGAGVARGGGPGLGVAGRLLARVVSSVVSSTISNREYATNRVAPAAVPPAAAKPAPPAPDTAVALALPPGPVPQARESAAAAGAVPQSGVRLDQARFTFTGDVAFSDHGSVYPLSPRAGAGGDVLAGPVPPRTEVAVAGPTMTIGGPRGSSGSAWMDGGRFEADLQTIGGRGRGEFHQRGGTNVVQDMRLGVEPGSFGQYQLQGGELVFKPGRGRGTNAGSGGTAPAGAPQSPTTLQTGTPQTGTPQAGTPQTTGLQVGDQGTGVFLLGNANGTGAIDTTADSPYGSLVVRGDPAGVGVFRGWGRVTMGGVFELNGQAIADGYGSDRALEFGGFRYVGSSIENPADGGTAGWFARDHGKLVLPAFRVRSGTAAYTWGEDPGDSTLDLVNSARLTLHDVARPGLMQISLLSKDNGEVPTLPRGHTFIGVWKMETGTLQYGDVDLVVRYDDGLAHELHLNENILKLWRYQDGQWIRMDHDASFWRDPSQHLLGVTIPAGGFDYFAVSAPEPAAIGVVAFGGALALLRRPRRRTDR